MMTTAAITTASAAAVNFNAPAVIWALLTITVSTPAAPIVGIGAVILGVTGVLLGNTKAPKKNNNHSPTLFAGEKAGASNSNKKQPVRVK